MGNPFFDFKREDMKKNPGHYKGKSVVEQAKLAGKRYRAQKGGSSCTSSPEMKVGGGSCTTSPEMKVGGGSCTSVPEMKVGGRKRKSRKSRRRTKRRGGMGCGSHKKKGGMGCGSHKKKGGKKKEQGEEQKKDAN